MSDLAAALRSVRDGYSEYEYVRRVKTAVIDEMQRIDASVQVEDTQYFNHSAIPDLLVRWKGEVQSRPLYLRGSYAAIIAARDASYITSGQPILVAMDPEQQDYDEPVDHQRLIEEASSAPSTLITDAAAMGALADPPLTTETPLGPLVRANYLRGGRGLIDPERARTLVEAGSSEALAREGLQEIVRQSFLPDAALRLERTAQLIDLALSQRALEDEQLVNADLLSGTGGRLSVSELRAILPWLMRQDGLTDDGRFWSRLGDLLDLRLLERAGGELVDVDISRLVRANANKWLCRRAYLGLSVLQGDDSV